MKKAKKKSGKTARQDAPETKKVLEGSEFVETVLESLTHPFYVIDAENYTIQIANSAARLGIMSGDSTCYALTHKRSRPCGMKEHPCPLEIVKKTKQPVTVEHVHYDKAGSTRNVEVHGFPVFDGDGNVIQMIEYCLDITDRKRAEEALKFEKDKLTNILDSMEDGVYIASEHYDIEYINPSLTREFGAPNGRKCYEYFYDRGDKCPWCKSQEVFNGATVQWEWYCPANNRTYDLIDTPISNPDGSVSKLEIFRDITDRKRMEVALRQSEWRYRSFVQNFQGIVYQGHLDFVPVFFHGAVEKITGYRESDFVAGRPRWDQIIHSDDLAAIADSAEQVRTTPGYAARREYRIVRKDGQIRWVHELIQNVCDDSGEPNVVQGAIYDITDRKLMEDDLRRHHERLEELVQARTTELTKVNAQLLEEIARRRSLEKELLGVVEREQRRTGRELHDSIGQQLTGIGFMIEVLGQKLAEKSLTEEASYSEKINRRIRHAIEQTHSLVKGLRPVDLDRNGLAFALQELAVDTEQLFNITCTFMCEDNVTIYNVSVASNLYRIAQEAITNAVKHGKTRNITLELTEKNDCLILRVDNDGLDFPERTFAGGGMGLSIMRYRAEMIDGSLDIGRGAAGGTCVTCVVSNKAQQ